MKCPPDIIFARENLGVLFKEASLECHFPDPVIAYHLIKIRLPCWPSCLFALCSLAQLEFYHDRGDFYWNFPEFSIIQPI